MFIHKRTHKPITCIYGVILYLNIGPQVMFKTFFMTLCNNMNHHPNRQQQHNKYMNKQSQLYGICPYMFTSM